MTVEQASAHSVPKMIRSIGALGLVQISGYVLPLATLPYLTRVLGVEQFGKIALAQASMTYGVLLVDFGFSLSATRRVAVAKGDHIELSRIASATWIAQWVLVVIAGLLFVPMAYFLKLSEGDLWITIASFTSVIAAATFPMWLFQGLERLETSAAVQLLTRIIALLFLFALVRKPEDAFMVPLINGGTLVIGGLMAVNTLQRRGIIKLHTSTRRDVAHEIKHGLSLFGSKIVISTYSTMVPLALGWFAGASAVAQFNLADRIRIAAQALLSPVSQVLYPRISHLVNADPSSATYMIRKSALPILFIAGGTSLFLWSFSGQLVLLLGGRDFKNSPTVLRWLSFAPFAIGLSNLFGIQVMLTHGLSRIFNGILVSAGILAVLLVSPLILLSAEVGAAQTVVIVESWVTLAMAYAIWRKGLFVRFKARKE